MGQWPYLLRLPYYRAYSVSPALEDWLPSRIFADANTHEPKCLVDHYGSEFRVTQVERVVGNSPTYVLHLSDGGTLAADKVSPPPDRRAGSR